LICKPYSNLITKNKMNNTDNTTYHYLDGSTYKGKMLNGMKNGKGTYKIHTPYGISIYIGGWKDDLFHGAGEYTFWKIVDEKPLKVIYKGDMRHGEADGNGTLVWEDGIQVSGHWEKSQCFHGTITSSEGVYFGDIGENRYPNGFGQMKYSNGVIKEGDFIP